MKKLPKIYKDEFGSWFEEKPEGIRVATLADFSENGDILIGKPYLIHSLINPNRFEAHRTKPGFMHVNDFFTFLERGRVYVFKERK